MNLYRRTSAARRTQTPPTTGATRRILQQKTQPPQNRVDGGPQRSQTPRCANRGGGKMRSLEGPRPLEEPRRPQAA